MAQNPFLGMRGTGEFHPDSARPTNFRQGYLKLFPNGTAPLNAMLSMYKSEPVNDPKFTWYDKLLPARRAVCALYTDFGLTTAYTGGAAGTVVYVRVARAEIVNFRANQQIKLRNTGYDTAGTWIPDASALVLSTSDNGSYGIIESLVLTDDSVLTRTTGATDNIVMVIGSAHPEGSHKPDAIMYDPDENYNYTQIFRDTLDITGTAMETFLRTGDAYKMAREDALESHMTGMEWGFLFGDRSQRIGSNGKPQRTTGGLIPLLTSLGYASDYSLDSTYSAATWLTSGEDWLDNELEEMFRFGDTEKLGLCGAGALTGINKLVKNNSRVVLNLEPKAKAYGIQVVEWVHPHGVIHLKTHPLFSYESSTNNMILLVEPKNLKYRALKNRDTKFEKDMQQPGQDSKVDGFRTEAGLEVHHPRVHRVLGGVGVDNHV